MSVLYHICHKVIPHPKRNKKQSEPGSFYRQIRRVDHRVFDNLVNLLSQSNVRHVHTFDSSGQVWWVERFPHRCSLSLFYSPTGGYIGPRPFVGKVPQCPRVTFLTDVRDFSNVNRLSYKDTSTTKHSLFLCRLLKTSFR